MKLSPEMIEARLPELLHAARREAVPLGPARIACGPRAGAQAPDCDDAAWERLDVGDRWGGTGLTSWLRVPIGVPRVGGKQSRGAHRAVRCMCMDVGGGKTWTTL